MKIPIERRQFLKAIEKIGSCTMLGNFVLRTFQVAPNQTNPNQAAPTPSNSPTVNQTTGDRLQGLYNSIRSQMQSFDSAAQQNDLGGYRGYNGPEIQADTGSSRPITSDELEDLEGATREDFPSDYMDFDPQTGMFSDVDYWL
jgi:hypothetical protein